MYIVIVYIGKVNIYLEYLSTSTVQFQGALELIFFIATLLKIDRFNIQTQTETLSLILLKINFPDEIDDSNVTSYSAHDLLVQCIAHSAATAASIL